MKIIEEHIFLKKTGFRNEMQFTKAILLEDGTMKN